jgi:hypothetical protein
MLAKVPSGSTVSEAFCVCSPRVAEIVAGVEAVTVAVEIVNVAEDSPGPIVSVFGTIADLLVLVSVTVVLLTTAPESTTLPVELALPVTVFGLTDRLVKVTGVIVRVAVLETDARLARMVAVEFLETLFASTLKVAVVAPPATSIPLGSDTRALGPVSAT